MDHAATQALLNGLPLPVLLIAPDERISQANAPAIALFGTAMLDRHHALSFRNPELLQAISAAAQQAKPGRVRLTLPAAAQDSIYEVSVSPVPQGVLCAFEDRSAWEQMDQMRRDFVANVSHELRTPLTALLGFIETLRGPARNDAPARERFLVIMASEAERMNRLVRDLLHLSRVESEERVLPSEDIDIAGLLRSVTVSLRPVAEAARVTIKLQGADQPLLIRADHDQMTQVLTNLVENAVKYGSPAGAEVQLALAPEQGPRGQQLRISVTDQGEGIDPFHIPRLTERFYRVDGHRSREKGGTGLGLAIVKHIVNRHRGRLIIESKKGKGSRFSVLLPYEPR
ncbi:two-component sensor histidine kinase [Cypionkella aquatica]|uniref:histidine kinase n=1 Tax=Cypionkella aquatica TaxID=1756042 RepID=A0AA37X2J7_9RHOB|nr:ATP-binding protein [Cypionkella aquatica]GLS87635.1 two-component sensor histidine kinase [Cypionkella aquatica]